MVYCLAVVGTQGGRRFTSSPPRLCGPGRQEIVYTVVVLHHTFDPVFCFNCWKHGHISKRCKNPSRCGFCSGDHNVKACSFYHTNFEAKKCPNCGGAHEAWRIGICTAPEVVTVRKRCERDVWLGPYWHKCEQNPPQKDSEGFALVERKREKRSQRMAPGSEVMDDVQPVPGPRVCIVNSAADGSSVALRSIHPNNTHLKLAENGPGRSKGPKSIGSTAYGSLHPDDSKPAKKGPGRSKTSEGTSLTTSGSPRSGDSKRPKGKRGRPRKAAETNSTVGAGSTASGSPRLDGSKLPKRKPGRPRKAESAGSVEVTSSAVNDSPAQGRSSPEST